MSPPLARPFGKRPFCKVVDPLAFRWDPFAFRWDPLAFWWDPLANRWDPLAFLLGQFAIGTLWQLGPFGKFLTTFQDNCSSASFIDQTLYFCLIIQFSFTVATHYLERLIRKLSTYFPLIEIGLKIPLFDSAVKKANKGTSQYSLIRPTFIRNEGFIYSEWPLYTPRMIKKVSKKSIKG